MYNYLRPSPLRYLSLTPKSRAISLTPYRLIALSFSHTYALSFSNATLTSRYPSLTFASSYASSCVFLLALSHCPCHMLALYLAPSFSHLRTVLVPRGRIADPSSVGSPSPRETSLIARRGSPFPAHDVTPPAHRIPSRLTPPERT